MEKEEIIILLKSLIQDMEAHAYNDYKDDDEIPAFLTVKQIYWLYDALLKEEE